MEWFHHRPTEPGLYMRSNPPASQIVRQGIVLIDGKLFMGHVEGGLVPHDRIPERFWWYGPIPEPPWKSKV